jgi:tRNA nucleotidyltransferase (CCA-adding enzyme)
VVLHPLRTAGDAAGIARAARGAPVEVVALAGGHGARRWLDELRHLHLAIDGTDLLAAGVPAGPEVGARLQRALDAHLNGRPRQGPSSSGWRSARLRRVGGRTHIRHRALTA